MVDGEWNSMKPIIVSDSYTDHEVIGACICPTCLGKRKQVMEARVPKTDELIITPLATCYQCDGQGYVEVWKKI